MNEELNKEMMVSESDPQSLEEHSHHEPDSFMYIYRSIDISRVQEDVDFVDKCVRAGVIPSSLRYGVMQRNQMVAYRGIVKSTTDNYYYFNWAPQTDFRLVPADDATKQWEAQKLFKTCSFGCDMRKAEAPLSPGESIEGCEEEEVSEDDADKANAPNIWPAGSPSRDEDKDIREQESDITDAHPGATIARTPDDPNIGRIWHEKALSRPGDGAMPLATNDGEQHWNTADLMKAWGKKLQESAPVVQPQITPLESRYLQEVMGMSQADVNKGLRIPARHRISFEQWKSGQLRSNIDNLKSWLKK